MNAEHRDATPCRRYGNHTHSVGEGQCPSRNVTHYTEVRWFHGIAGGSMPRPYGE